MRTRTPACPQRAPERNETTPCKSGCMCMHPWPRTGRDALWQQAEGGDLTYKRKPDHASGHNGRPLPLRGLAQSLQQHFSAPNLPAAAEIISRILCTSLLRREQERRSFRFCRRRKERRSCQMHRSPCLGPLSTYATYTYASGPKASKLLSRTS